MRVAILATRISGTDGVTFEAIHWKEILESLGHKVEFIAGELGYSGILIPELHFQWPEVVKIQDKVIRGEGNYQEVEEEIFEIAGKIEGRLRKLFNDKKNPDLLIVPNAFSIPMHFPLSVALARVIKELDIPTIARHHDFWWERERFLKSDMFSFFKRWFPPDLPNIKHVVINSIAQKELKKRTGIESELIWDSFNFDSDLNKKDSYSKNWRKDFGIAKDDIVFLQATRIVPRKRIEISIELMKKLAIPNSVLVLAGYSGDEGVDYSLHMHRFAMRSKIRFISIGNFVNTERKIKRTSDSNGNSKHRIYTLWDCYVNSDFCTYPTKTEGFGNQFVEAVYFRKPMILTPYPVFEKDIEPLGFETIKLPGKVTKKAVKQTKALIENPDKKADMVENNFKIGQKYLSYTWVEKKLKKIFKSIKINNN